MKTSDKSSEISLSYSFSMIDIPSWIRLDLGVDPDQIRVGSEHQFVLRLLTEGKPIDFPFRIIIAELEKEQKPNNSVDCDN